jgi:hypothetical protein
MSNLFPAFVSVYNLVVHLRAHNPEVIEPASAEETRSVIAGRVHEFGDKVRSQFSSERASATGTHG